MRIYSVIKELVFKRGGLQNTGIMLSLTSLSPSWWTLQWRKAVWPTAVVTFRGTFVSKAGTPLILRLPWTRLPLKTLWSRVNVPAWHITEMSASEISMSTTESWNSSSDFKLNKAQSIFTGSELRLNKNNQVICLFSYSYF